MIGLLMKLYAYVSMILLKVRGVQLKGRSLLRFPFYVKHGKFITIGTNAFIGKNSKLYCFQSDNCCDSYGGITIGNDFCAQENLFISSLDEGKIVIGNSVLLGSNVMINNNDHIVLPEQNGDIRYKIEDIIIGNNCWIAENVCILKGVTIGDYAVIGAGAIVTKDIPAYSIAVGNPARVIKLYDQEQKRYINV